MRMVRWVEAEDAETWPTNIESVASHVVSDCRSFAEALAVHSPIVLNGFDDETKCWTDRVHVFVHQSLYNRGFAGIVQASETASAKQARYKAQSTYSIRILISLSFNRALRKIESIVAMTPLPDH